METAQQIITAMAYTFIAITALIVLAMLCGVPEAWAHYSTRRAAEKRVREHSNTNP